MNQDLWPFLFSPYGSKLYGTNTPSSDTDNKVIYVPALNDLLLGRKSKVFKTRLDAAGNKVPDDASMPDSGIEEEYIPLQTFARDFVAGQTYAVEVAHAFVANPPPKDRPGYHFRMEAYEFVVQLVDNFANADVYSMVGFATKQTFDYVRRGERLNDARAVQDVLFAASAAFLNDEFVASPRLDSRFGNGELVLDFVAREAKLKTSTSVNNNRTLRTLELNGRSYLETTTLEHIYALVSKLIKSYGDRTNAAAEKDVDFKSLSHAVRVYEQSIELLETGKITFPRANAAELLRIKQGHADLEEVRDRLIVLDETVKEKIASSTVRKRTPELEASAEQWLLVWLRHLYRLN